MTVFLPLEASSPLPQSPSFLLPTSDPDAQVTKVIKAIMKAKRIVVVCGAGISVQAGIPDFRSSEGLFQTLKRDNPRESLTSGKDLFDASVFNSEYTTSLFCQMIARLSELSHAAEPTPFHRLLRALDDRGKLLRVYTQNIDAIESKSGLSFGVPEFDDRRYKPRSKGKVPLPTEVLSPPFQEPITPSRTPHRLPSPVADTPRCIPLHGTLQSMHCQTCTHSCPLENHLPSLTSGTPPECPECTSMEATRQLVGKRARGVGKLRPSVVLYNETHKDGEVVGEIVRKDLIGGSKGKGRSGADLLLVVGTSLRVPGTKRIVREFAKAVRSRSSIKDPNSGLLTPVSSPRRSPATDDEPQVKAAYLNIDFPVPTREWEGVFDVWLQGDAQHFADMLREAIEKEVKAKEVASEKKKKREEEAAFVAMREKAAKGRKKRKLAREVVTRPIKRRKVDPSPSARVKSTSSMRGKSTTAQSKPVKPEKQTRPKIILRIPARPRPTSSPTRKLSIPEVYITTSPQSAARKTMPGALRPPPTPARTPPPLTRRRVSQPNITTGRGAASRGKSKDKNIPYCAPKLEQVTVDSGDESSELSDVPDELPALLVRTVQYGLRGA